MNCPRCRATMIAVVHADGSDGYSCPFCAGVERAIALAGSRACPDCMGLMDQLTEYGVLVDKWTCKPCSSKKASVAAAEAMRRSRKMTTRAEWISLAGALLAGGHALDVAEVGTVVDGVLSLADERFGEK